VLLGWIGGRQLDAIAKKWIYLRSLQGRRSESARLERIRKQGEWHLERLASRPFDLKLISINVCQLFTPESFLYPQSHVLKSKDNPQQLRKVTKNRMKRKKVEIDQEET
jgi:hypothetical protein